MNKDFSNSNILLTKIGCQAKKYEYKENKRKKEKL